MSDEIQKNILTEIRARHEQDQRWRNGPSMICPHAHDDRGWLLSEIERLRAERNALKSSAREFLTTLGAAMKTGKFHMNGSADMCHFVRQAMQKLDVLAFDREEKRPVGLERLHEEAKP